MTDNRADIPTAIDVPVDGRQSMAAAAIQRGVARMLRAHGFTCIFELTLANGRRADVVGLGPGAELWIVEIKSSIQDFRVDTKWPDYRIACDRLFFATNADVPLDIFPADAGLIRADAFGAELIRTAPEHKLPGATRKAMLVRFAHAAASRLHALHDPDAGQPMF